MDLKVSFSKTAEKNLDSVLKFIEARWSEKSKKIFIVKFEKAISIMVMNPEIFPKSTVNKKYRKCVITKHRAYYIVLVQTKSGFTTFSTPDKTQIK